MQPATNTSATLIVQPATDTCKMLEDPEKINVMQENRKLRAQ